MVRRRAYCLTLLLVVASALAVPAAYAAHPHLPPPISTGSWWRPSPNLTWQWQLTTPVDIDVDAEVFNIDLFDNDAAIVAALQKKGRKVICYVSAGSWEDWRPDAARFPRSVLGRRYEGWPGERWLDIRRIDLLAPIMLARLDLCRAKGFDGVELDNVDAYTNKTGFALSANDQLRYNAWLANEARARGLAVGLKNDPGQINALLPYFDWALAESCFAQGWCAVLKPFVAAGKAVFAAEYTDTKVDLDRICSAAASLQVSVLVKNRELDAFRRDCQGAPERARRR